MEDQDPRGGGPEAPFGDRDSPGSTRGYMLEMQGGHLLRRAHQRSKVLFAERIGALKLTPRQFAALVKVSEQGEVSQNLLGRMAAMDPATAQGVVRRLFAKNLVARRPDPNDQRRTLLRLTPSGEETVRQAIERLDGMNDDLLASLTVGERRAFLDLLKRIAA